MAIKSCRSSFLEPLGGTPLQQEGDGRELKLSHKITFWRAARPCDIPTGSPLSHISEPRCHQGLRGLPWKQQGQASKVPGATPGSFSIEFPQSNTTLAQALYHFSSQTQRVELGGGKVQIHSVGQDGSSHGGFSPVHLGIPCLAPSLCHLGRVPAEVASPHLASEKCLVNTCGQTRGQGECGDTAGGGDMPTPQLGGWGEQVQ